ncbi:MAG: TlpA family protein disulfide reductase [Rhodospirillaceae bacterium]|nr:TlpA family protein disulfide reductase [Rhodospirillaceae bacterium]
MNPKNPNRKRFINPLLITAMVISAVISVIAIVVISTNLSTPDNKSAYSSMAGASAGKALGPVELIGEMKPPSLLAGRIMATEIDGDAFSTQFFDVEANGQTIKNLAGNGLIINFWATWCVPCVKEMPALDNLAALLGQKGVKVIALSVDRLPLEKVPAFYLETGIKNLDVLYDDKGVISRLMGVKGLPTTVLVKSDGTVFGSVSGMMEWDNPEVVSYLARVLVDKTPQKEQ